MEEEKNIDLNDKKFLRIKDFKEYLKSLREGLNVEHLKLNNREFFKDNKLLLSEFIINKPIDNYMNISL